ncbi:hypothetical protein A3Q56_07353 [Intoshia linei]|uniref:Uncharacterized protein n=1 Tax=Intoshia linei TaxID=1819745 RepID=A0A177ATM5_9BILA|nr:hypothetical protein A3Q56_07353 [Intoshia linei]
MNSKLKVMSSSKLVNYTRSILNDYKLTLKELYQYKKTCASTLFVGSCVHLLTKHYDKRYISYSDKVVQFKNELCMLDEPLRSKQSYDYVMKKYCTKNEIKDYKFGPIHLSIRNKIDNTPCIFQDNCKDIRPNFLYRLFEDYEFQDVNIFGSWLFLNYAMIEYDVNEKEWGEENKKSFFKLFKVNV